MHYEKGNQQGVADAGTTTVWAAAGVASSPPIVGLRANDICSPPYFLLLSLLPALSTKVTRVTAATHQPWLLPITVRTTGTLQFETEL